MRKKLPKYYRNLIISAGLDLSLVGRKLARGKQHRVHLYGEDQVVKMPRKSLFMKAYGGISYDQVKYDLEYLQQYFEDVLPQTSVLQAGSKGKYVVLQKHIVPAGKLTTHNADLYLEQLQIMTKTAKKCAVRDSIYVDFFGNKGLVTSLKSLLPFSNYTPLLTNVVTRDTKIYLVDINLLRVGKSSKSDGLFHRFSDAVTVILSSLLLSYFFKQKIEMESLLVTLRYALVKK